jgi:hypothetical protein
MLQALSLKTTKELGHRIIHTNIFKRIRQHIKSMLLQTGFHY